MEMDLTSEQFMSEEEATAAADEMIKEIAEAVQQDECGVHVTNPKRVRDVKVVYRLLKYITSGKQLRIFYELNKPYASMAYISIIGKELEISNPGWFALCSNIASNVEIYARADGNVQINLTFNNFTSKVE